jgi:hypothetical protein
MSYYECHTGSNEIISYEYGVQIFVTIPHGLAFHSSDMLGRPKSAGDLTAFLVPTGHMFVMKGSQYHCLLYSYTGASKELRPFVDDRIANQDLCLLLSLAYTQTVSFIAKYGC